MCLTALAVVLTFVLASYGLLNNIYFYLPCYLLVCHFFLVYLGIFFKKTLAFLHFVNPFWNGVFSHNFISSLKFIYTWNELLILLFSYAFSWNPDFSQFMVIFYHLHDPQLVLIWKDQIKMVIWWLLSSTSYHLSQGVCACVSKFYYAVFNIYII